MDSVIKISCALSPLSEHLCRFKSVVFFFGNIILSNVLVSVKKTILTWVKAGGCGYPRWL